MVPKHDSLRQDVLYNLHDASISGHPGIRRTKKLVRRSYWWPGMDTDIESYVQTCATCQRDKARTHAATVPLLPLDVPGTPWQSVSMVFITALPKTKAGKTAILVFVCKLTKMVHHDVYNYFRGKYQATPCASHKVTRGWVNSLRLPSVSGARRMMCCKAQGSGSHQSTAWCLIHLVCMT